MNDIRTAILKAADHIERNPSAFNFSSIAIPSKDSCGTPGCALGWIAAYAGLPRCHYGFSDGARVLGVGDSHAFYRLMDKAQSIFHLKSWQHSAAVCAKTMRRYADKYHPAPKVAPAVAPVVRYPDWTAMAAQRTVSMDAVSQEVARV